MGREDAKTQRTRNERERGAGERRGEVVGGVKGRRKGKTMKERCEFKKVRVCCIAPGQEMQWNWKRSIFSVCYFEFRGTVAGKRENWGQTGKRQEQKVKGRRERKHISSTSYHRHHSFQAYLLSDRITGV